MPRRETAFDPLLPGLMGNFGGDFYDGDKVHLIPDVSIVDLVQVPPNLRGDFVLQFRKIVILSRFACCPSR